MALNYSSKHDISYANYNNKTIPWKVNASIIFQNNQITDPSLNIGTNNNNLVIESSQNNILFITSENNNKKVIVKNNMTIKNLDVSNTLTTKLNDASSITLNNKLYLPERSVNIIGDLKVGGSITIIGSTATGLVKSESQFINVTLSGSRFTDVSIVNSNISYSDFSNVNIINSYIYNIPFGYGFDKSNNSYPNKAIFSDVSLQRLVLDSSINSYINFAANANSANSIIIRSSDDYSKLKINKPLNIGIGFGETISNISNVSIFYGTISCNTLYYSQLVPDIRLNTYFDISIGQVSVSGNNIPVNNSFNIGSTDYKFNEIISNTFVGDLSGAVSSANDLRKNLDMSFNNLDIYGTFTLNRQNLNQFLSGDLISIVAADISFINANNKVRDLSISLYSKTDVDLCLNSNFTKISLLDASLLVLNNSITSISSDIYTRTGFDLCLNRNFAKISLVDASLLVLNNSITSISASVYSKSDFDLCLNRNILSANDVSTIVSVVTNPTQIYPMLGYIDSSLNKVTNSKVTNELAFPYAITYIDDLVEDTNLKESYSYSKTTTRYTNSTSTKYIETSTTTSYNYYGPAAQSQPNNVNLTRAVMVYVLGDSARTPTRYRTWFNTDANSTLPAVYVNVKRATPRVVSYAVNTTKLTWEQHRVNAQQVRGRYLATILNSSEQTAAQLAAMSKNVWIGAKRKPFPQNTSWEWSNGDPWTYENFDGGEPNNVNETRISMLMSGRWNDYGETNTLDALYMTVQLLPYTNNQFEGNTSLLTWANHKIQAESVIDRFLATIESSDQNTQVAECIANMSISNQAYKNGTGSYIGAMRTAGSSAYGVTSSDWQWTNETPWSYKNFYYQEQTQLYTGSTTTYSAFIPQQPTNVSSSAPEGQQPITIDVSNTKLPTLISSVNGTITVTSSAVGALNLPGSTTSNIIIGSPSSSAITSPTSTTREYTTTITTYTLTDTYAHNGTALVLSATATGGNIITTSGAYRIHTFTANGTFTPSFNGTVEVLLVGGGGGGGSIIGGGGGGGGVIYMPVVDVSAGQNYTIEVGSGGPSNTSGQPSKAFTAIAGGGGTSGPHNGSDGTSGGSGGGAASNNTRINQGGAGLVGSSLGINSGIIYGNRGGHMITARINDPTRAAGGGGAGGQGLDTDSNITGADLNSKLTGDTGQTGAGSGGVGIINNILGITYYWGGGGGGGAFWSQCGGYGGFGGGGGGAGYDFRGGMGGINAYNNGSNGSSGNNANGGNGGANTGGGGGGGTWGSGLGGTGGSGIVIIRYLQQQPIGSFKISDNDNNKFNYIRSSASALPTTIPTNYSCIALTNDGMFVALGLASNVTVYMKNSSGWQTLGSPITVDFSAYTGSSVGIIPTQFTEIWRKNLQNLAINYISGSSNPTLFLAFGNTRTSVQLYSYDNATWSLSNGFYSVTGGSWALKTSYSAAALSVSTNTNFGYFVTLSHSPNILGFTVDDKFYTYNCTNYTIRGSRQTLPNSNSTYTNIIAFKKSSDAEKIIVSNTYYVFIYKWNINDWTLLTTINLVSAAITFTYPNTSTTPIPAGPRNLDISNISSNECVFAIGFPDVLINKPTNNRSRGYVEYWKFSNNILTRLATLVPRKRNFTNNDVDNNEYFFGAGGIKITNSNTILVAPNFKFHFNSTNKNYTLATSNLNWSTHNNSSNAKSISGREIASIENEADNELVKITARNNVVWIGAMRISNISTGITSTDWQWSDTSSSWNYTSFASGEPNRFAETRIQSLSGTWYDTDALTTSRAVYMTRLQYSLNTFTIFNNFYFHSSGFTSSYANTAISSTVIAKWIRTDTPSTLPIEFRGNGDLVSNGKGIFTISDIRLKENIVDSTSKLEDLLKVRVVNYNLKGSKDNKLIGVVAQELEELFPTLVNNGELSHHDIYLGKTESYKSVKYSCFDVILIKAFQEQVAIINKLTSQLDEIDSKTKLLKAISQDFVILKQELDLLKRENELFKLNINEILKLI